jgi:Lrp/AsnC family transcriptional regulator, regulator for asnA, asnC and gidA
MDKLDYLILSELLKDASLSFVKVAKKVGTSPYTVRRRYEKLKKKGMILKCIISIDLTKLGYQGKAFLLITVEPNSNKTDTINCLTKLRNVIVVTEIIGPYDILAIAPISDLNSIQELVLEVRKAPNLERIEIACIDDIHFPVSPNLGTILSEKCVSLATEAT